jgi:hypothetical protein
MRVVEIVIAILAAASGARSLVRWLGRPFQPATPGERLLYALHLTCRVGFWFALSVFFATYGIVDEPQRLRWFVVIPIALAGVQMLTGLRLGRGGER